MPTPILAALPTPFLRRSVPRTRAFTLIELLVTMAVGGLLIVFLIQLFNASVRAWQQGENQTETYREARTAMQMMVRDLSQTIQPMNGSVYASPSPTPGATPKNIVPVLVIDHYNHVAPTNGGGFNEEVYCLTTIANNGASNLCAVGYFCQWKPEFDTSPRASHAYSLMRQSLGSGAPANVITGTAAVPGLYDRFKLYGNSTPLSFLNVYERADTGKPPATDPPQSSVTELAAYIWDLQIRTPASLQDAAATPAYPTTPTYMGATSYATALPPYLEIRFKALSEAAARQLEGNMSVTADTWNDSDPTKLSDLYKRIILPGTRQFVTRVPIYSGSATSTPTP